MGLYELLRPLAFRMDAERVHEMGLKLISEGRVKVKVFEDPRLKQSVFGVHFPNPLGLAAGFDKNGVALDHWHKLGFGFVEAGTVTLDPQPGNPRPRIFRIPEELALINRLGFNNEGALQLSKNLLHADPQIPIGLNFGKSKVVPLIDAPQDYAGSFRRLVRQGAYFVINVSSPNTPGLRDLQAKDQLWDVFAAVKEVDPSRPILVKIAPDLSWEEIDDIIEVALRAEMAGFVATNTTTRRDNLPENHLLKKQEGGQSGRPLRDRAQEVLEYLYKNVPKEMVLIGVGGIFDGDDLYNRLAAGAHLCQMYTGFIYGGPQTVPRALAGLVARMEREGIWTMEELRGSANK